MSGVVAYKYAMSREKAIILNESDQSITVKVDDFIGFWGIEHQEIKGQLDQSPDSDVILNISSLGGDVTHATSIYNALKSHNGRVVANIYGDSASAATLIAMAADTVNIAENAMFLIHNVWTMAVGDAGELRKVADEMDGFNENIVTAYKKKTGENRRKIRGWMNEDKWWDAKTAKERGFVDKIQEPEKILRNEAVLNHCMNEKVKSGLIMALKNSGDMPENKDTVLTDNDKNWFLKQIDKFTGSKNEPKEEPKAEEPKEFTAAQEEAIKEKFNALQEKYDGELKNLKESVSNLEEENEKLKKDNQELRAASGSPSGTQAPITGDEKNEDSELDEFVNGVKALVKKQTAR